MTNARVEKEEEKRKTAVDKSGVGQDKRTTKTIKISCSWKSIILKTSLVLTYLNFERNLFTKPSVSKEKCRRRYLWTHHIINNKENLTQLPTLRLTRWNSVRKILYMTYIIDKHFHKYIVRSPEN